MSSIFASSSAVWTAVDAYVQHIDDFATSSETVRDSYDVVVFYHMLMEGPRNTGLPGYAGEPKAVLEHLGETTQGIFRPPSCAVGLSELASLE